MGDSMLLQSLLSETKVLDWALTCRCRSCVDDDFLLLIDDDVDDDEDDTDDTDRDDWDEDGVVSSELISLVGEGDLNSFPLTLILDCVVVSAFAIRSSSVVADCLTAEVLSFLSDDRRTDADFLILLGAGGGVVVAETSTETCFDALFSLKLGEDNSVPMIPGDISESCFFLLVFDVGVDLDDVVGFAVVDLLQLSFLLLSDESSLEIIEVGVLVPLSRKGKTLRLLLFSDNFLLFPVLCGLEIFVVNALFFLVSTTDSSESDDDELE